MNAGKLQTRLAAVRRKQLLCVAGTGVALVLLSVVSLLSIGMIIDWLAELPWWGRAVLLAVNLGLIGYIVWRQFVLPVRAAGDEDECALLVEQAVPEFQTRLIASVQLSRPGAVRAGESAAMVRELIAQTETLAESVNFTAVISAVQTGVVALVAAVLVSAATMTFLVGAPITTTLLKRAFLWNVPVPHKTQITVLSGNLKIGRGDSVVIEARAAGIIPLRGKVTLRSVTRPTQELTILPMAGDSKHFLLSIDNVQDSFTYTIKLNDDTTEPNTVTVYERPVVTAIECQQVYPSYTHLGTVRREVTDLTLLAGSRLELNITANKPIVAGLLRLVGVNTNLALRVSPTDPHHLTGTLGVPASGLTGFTVGLQDTDGLHSKELALYRIDVVPDKPPTVVITYPERKEQLVTSRATVVIGLEAHDDFGVAKLLFHYRCPAIKAGVEQVAELDLDGATPRTVRRRHEWNLATLGVTLPTDTVIEYWLEARDTNDVTGPGIAQTEHYFFKVVSEADKRADLMDRLDNYLNILGGVAEQQEKLNQNLGATIFGKPQ